ncbi:TetR/AcrR family transcriptional regulator [Enterocloster lavalensis]|uniref:TetR/AcrR family transcriptional regulator n=1 Tax=Enterocloster lavalensis TaxID=460384 RepID=UPI001D08F2CB|nr:TetR/AcrR family transcriptional regulator [Enterocloster lavalensis]MCB6343917.1 TetR/AcrR family transcriptional regulator [Enterocloster lavalensis]
MRTKDEENEQRQRQQILNTAWQLFYQKGYQNTTMEDILRGARCSKGRFYYYFHAKAELLDSLYEIFDQKYIELYGLICREAHARDQLLEINRYMFQFLSNEIGAELLTSLYISQLSGTTGISFWGEERAVRRILSSIVSQGQKLGQLTTKLDCSQIVTDIIEEERSLLISWCLAKGEYDLTEASMPKLERFYRSYRED